MSAGVPQILSCFVDCPSSVWRATCRQHVYSCPGGYYSVYLDLKISGKNISSRCSIEIVPSQILQNNEKLTPIPCLAMPSQPATNIIQLWASTDPIRAAWVLIFLWQETYSSLLLSDWWSSGYFKKQSLRLTAFCAWRDQKHDWETIWILALTLPSCMTLDISASYLRMLCRWLWKIIMHHPKFPGDWLRHPKPNCLREKT